MCIRDSFSNQFGDLSVAQHIKFVTHTEFVKRNVRSSNLWKFVRFDAGESSFVAELRQSHRQQVLYAFSACEMFAVDEVQDSLGRFFSSDCRWRQYFS